MCEDYTGLTDVMFDVENERLLSIEMVKHYRDCFLNHSDEITEEYRNPQKFIDLQIKGNKVYTDYMTEKYGDTFPYANRDLISREDMEDILKDIL